MMIGPGMPGYQKKPKQGIGDVLMDRAISSVSSHGPGSGAPPFMPRPAPARRPGVVSSHGPGSGAPPTARPVPRGVTPPGRPNLPSAGRPPARPPMAPPIARPMPGRGTGRPGQGPGTPGNPGGRPPMRPPIARPAPRTVTPPGPTNLPPQAPPQMVTPGGSTNLPPQGIVAPDGGMPIDPNTGAPVSMDLGAVSFDPNTGQGGNIEDELLRRFQMQQGWNY